MARPNEIGLDYFPLDVNIFDNDKIKLIESEFGVKGSYIFLRLLCSIYQKYGYYYSWNDDKKLLLAKSSGIEGNLVGEILTGLIRRSLFDKRVFDSFGLLTSSQIQKNYLEAVKRREKVPFDINVALIDISVYNNIINVDFMSTETQVNVDIGTQSKVEYSKVKKRKEKKSKKDPPNGDPAKTDFILILLNSFCAEYEKARGYKFNIPNVEKERSAIGKLLAIHKKEHPETDTETTDRQFRNYFAQCLAITDNWHIERMSPSHILNQFNPIRTILKKGKTNGTGTVKLKKPDWAG